MAHVQKKKYVILDRDGTIIVNKHYQKDPAATELLPNAFQGLHMLRESGCGLVVISNQSGIGRGLLTVNDVDAVNRSMVDALGGGDLFFEGMYYCPHVEEDLCGCRKPMPGLLLEAASALGFDPGDCYVVGDRESDMVFGKQARATTILVRTGYGKEEEKAGVRADYYADDLLDAARWIMDKR